MPIECLESYDISETRGFLCGYDATAVELTGDWARARDVAMRLPQMLTTGRVRELLRRDLPGIVESDLDSLSDSQARAAMVHFSFMVQSYVWGEAEASAALPECLARPMCALAERLGQQPLLPYSGYVLDNWGLHDPERPIDLSNIFVIQNFLGGQDENWFILVHVAIEARAGAALSRMKAVIDGVEAGNVAEVTEQLTEIATVWSDLKGIFDRMPERCDPYAYFERVRPYIHGWKDNSALPNGVMYEGVKSHSGKAQSYRGQTGSQSSIVPSMDALLGIGHAADPMKAYLDELHIYRPPGHRRFIDDLRSQSGLRDFVVSSADQDLSRAYNANVQAVADFRSRHLEYAASYINKQSRNATGNDTDVGTGGTPFMKYLKKHRDETQANLVSIG
ncbi:MAG: indoleamine 2,3-dioxygenase [Litorimonas sp.]